MMMRKPSKIFNTPNPIEERVRREGRVEGYPVVKLAGLAGNFDCVPSAISPIIYDIIGFAPLGRVEYAKVGRLEHVRDWAHDPPVELMQPYLDCEVNLEIIEQAAKAQFFPSGLFFLQSVEISPESLPITFGEFLEKTKGRLLADDKRVRNEILSILAGYKN